MISALNLCSMAEQWYSPSLIIILTTAIWHPRVKMQICVVTIKKLATARRFIVLRVCWCENYVSLLTRSLGARWAPTSSWRPCNRNEFHLKPCRRIYRRASLVPAVWGRFGLRPSSRTQEPGLVLEVCLPFLDIHLAEWRPQIVCRRLMYRPRCRTW